MQEGLLVILSGFSGAGKGTLVRELMKKYEGQYVLSISMATRKPREDEIDGVHYHFKTQEEFDAIVKEDGFLEYANYVGGSYGTPKAFVVENLAAGRDTIVEIELQGAQQIKAQYPNAFTIFVTPPSAEELKRRLVGRKSETNEEIEKRLKRAKEESAFVNWYEYILVNDNLDVAVDELHQIIEGRKKRFDLIIKMQQGLQEINSNVYEKGE